VSIIIKSISKILNDNKILFNIKLVNKLATLILEIFIFKVLIITELSEETRFLVSFDRSKINSLDNSEGLLNLIFLKNGIIKKILFLFLILFLKIF
tara:strand:+ start:325 stop:612 length:288 start_codon:yes stop_codon:yes gene_type:complete